MGKRAQQKEERRQQILSCSLELFIRKGYNGTTVRDIAKKAKVSVGLIFHYFETKEAILQELMNLAQMGVASSISIIKQSLSPIECFEQISNQIFSSFKSYPLTAGVFMLVHQTMMAESTPETIKESLKSMNAIKDTIPIIVEGQRQGDIKRGDPMALCIAFWGAIQGIAESLVWYPDTKVPEAKWIVDILRA